MQNKEYVFFWSGPFSQWASSKFKDDEGREYNCAEQYMMYHKARFFEDHEIARKIMEKKHPDDQKKLGRKVRNFNEGEWNKVARDIVYKGSYLKYTQNPSFMKALEETKGKILVEASPYDKIWGIGMDESNPNRFDESKWQGKNWLGEVLTKLRIDLIGE